MQNPITFSTPARLYHDRLVVVLVVDRVAVRACPECVEIDLGHGFQR
ncbi:hypothetical protein [Mycobacterium sp. 29Ha]|nr:hypothetical protein [Mycobacterium sp. 29Ha]MDV3135568.1 hypothetical protein [Mycobacterium sp. 29Ha]